MQVNVNPSQQKKSAQKLIGIDGKPWLGTDSFLDVSGLCEIHEEIVRGLTLIDHFEFAARREWSRGDAAEALYDNKYKCVWICETEMSSSELIFYKSLSRNQRFKYLKIAKGAYFPWSYVYDEQKAVKHYVKNSKTWIFHDCDFHGVDAVPYFAYNVRIDGIYTSDFRNKIKFGRKC